MSDLSKKEKNEDERRLFYVALTRAKLTCCITYANTYNSYSNQKEVIPSMFISEIDDEYIDYARDNHIKDEEALKSLLAQSSHQSNKKDEDVYLKELVDKFKLSVTSLNTYLECPYKFKLNNLLKVPRAKASYLAFGTAVHKAFESFFRKFQVDSLYPNKAFLINSFKEELAKEIMTKKDYESRLEQGRTILSAYFDFFSDDFVEPLFVEKFSRVYLEDIPLTGKIDVVVWEDRSDKTIKVIDFKTGKPKTKGQILGTTKDSNGNLYRQLAFYNLLIDLDRRLQVKFAKAELDFVQSPAEKNKSGKNTFTISQDQLNELKKTIHEVMGSIRSLSFPRTSDYSVCTRCEFKDHCWPDGIPNI